MSKQTEALKLALKALSPWAGEDANHTEQYAAYHAIREALAEQPEQQEPFGYFRYDLRLDAWVQNRAGLTGTPFYTSPPASKPWVALTDEEKNQVAWSCGSMSADWLEFADAIEAKLKEKNT